MSYNTEVSPSGHGDDILDAEASESIEVTTITQEKVVYSKHRASKLDPVFTSMRNTTNITARPDIAVSNWAAHGMQSTRAPKRLDYP